MMRGYCTRGCKACKISSWLKILLTSIDRFCATFCELKPKPFTCIDRCHRISYHHTHGVALCFAQFNRQVTVIVRKVGCGNSKLCATIENPGFFLCQTQ